MKNLLVRTKLYWSWAGGPVLIMRTVADNGVKTHISNTCIWETAFNFPDLI